MFRYLRRGALALHRGLHLYNSLTRRVEAVETLEPAHLKFYACGPTVYSYAHIGNFRSFLTADLIGRAAAAIGWKTTFVTNITDVGHLTQDDFADAGGEDRMSLALQSKEGERFANVWDLARYYTETMLADWRALNLREPDVRPRATEHVAQQIRAIETLLEKGHAYETDLGVYFSVPSFPDYGKLSGNIEAAQLEGERDVLRDPGKRDPRDFALWKRDPHHLMQWFSPWGWGFPGWHIECSAMSMAYLGEQFDLHTGGEDNKFPHHECEIAQSEALIGKPWVRYWAHTRFLEVEGEKMSKRFGNFYTVRDLINPSGGSPGVDPLALRLALISGQYRNPFNFTFDNLRAAVRHVQRFRDAKEAVRSALEDRGADPRADSGTDTGMDTGTAARTPATPFGEKLDALYTRALGAMLDDLNTPVAIAAAIEGARAITAARHDLGAAGAHAAHQWLERINGLLGIVEHENDVPSTGAPSTGALTGGGDAFAARVEALLEERTRARKEKDFARADAIRAELDSMEIEVKDGPEGSTWRRRSTIEL